jgi:hypothetical protein
MFSTNIVTQQHKIMPYVMNIVYDSTDTCCVQVVTELHSTFCTALTPPVYLPFSRKENKVFINLYRLHYIGAAVAQSV